MVGVIAAMLALARRLLALGDRVADAEAAEATGGLAAACATPMAKAKAAPVAVSAPTPTPTPTPTEAGDRRPRDE